MYCKSQLKDTRVSAKELGLGFLLLLFFFGGEGDCLVVLFVWFVFLTAESGFTKSLPPK